MMVLHWCFPERDGVQIYVGTVNCCVYEDLNASTLLTSCNTRLFYCRNIFGCGLGLGVGVP